MVKKKRNSPALVVSLLICAALLAAFVILAARIGSESDQKQLESLQSAIENDITMCYALEGTYPPSLNYMKEHYGLSWDENKFYVDYTPVAANIRPVCTVIAVE